MQRTVRSPLVSRLVSPGLGLAADALAKALCALDEDLRTGSLRRAALRCLARYGARGRVIGQGPFTTSQGDLPRTGGLLVVSNHPGLFDALSLFATIGREDLLILAADRPLFDALPSLRARLLAIDPKAGAAALLRAHRHLRKGHALLHFPAGRIEPDPALSRDFLSSWQPGIEALIAGDHHVVPALVSGVVSPRARKLAAAVAGARDATDAIVPLLQLTFPGFRDSEIAVHYGVSAPGRARSAAQLREALESLFAGGATGPTLAG